MYTAGQHTEKHCQGQNGNHCTKTIEAHRASLMRKLGLHKAADLVRYAIRHGLIDA